MMTYILINIGIGAAVCSALGVAALIRRKIHKVSLCDTCDRLIRKGGGGHFAHKYSCKPPGAYVITSDFDKPPRYCKNYVPREDSQDE